MPIDQTQKPILVVAQLPPPLSGQTVFNRAFTRFLEPRIQFKAIPLGVSTVDKLRESARILSTILFHSSRYASLYLSLPGNFGVWLTLPFVLAARLLGLRIVVHHHSYRPISRGPLASISMLNLLGGNKLFHVLLSAKMLNEFCTIYPGAHRTHCLVASNAALFYSPVESSHPTPKFTLGHLSVLTVAKGVDYLCDLFEAAVADGTDLRLILAGPIADERLRPRIDDLAIKYSERFEYRGAIYGDEKSQFYKDIDAFVLPSRLLDEAEPLVLYESYSHGLVFLGTDRGCIAERLFTRDHLLSMNLTDDKSLIQQLAIQYGDGQRHQMEIGAWASLLYNTGIGELESLLVVLKGASK